MSVAIPPNAFSDHFLDPPFEALLSRASFYFRPINDLRKMCLPHYCIRVDPLSRSFVDLPAKVDYIYRALF
ncbi:hypothetical protein ACIRP2_19400 [Streptomyces sp. NPDC101194]|uniref:hypothetical protein n=1 Tax=Streptomyces sp. NPDC101194 TaxID=3366127 RepID=UPI0037F6DBD9